MSDDVRPCWRNGGMRPQTTVGNAICRHRDWARVARLAFVQASGRPAGHRAILGVFKNFLIYGCESRLTTHRVGQSPSSAPAELHGHHECARIDEETPLWRLTFLIALSHQQRYHDTTTNAGACMIKQLFFVGHSADGLMPFANEDRTFLVGCSIVESSEIAYARSF